MEKRHYFCIFISIFISGCFTTDPKISFTPPAYVEEMPAKEVEDNFAQRGSLFGQGDNPLFADRRAMRLNDIVTIIINETANATSGGTNTYNETGATNLTAPTFSYAGGTSVGRALSKAGNDVFGLGVTTATNNNYNGSGTQARNGTLTTTIAARIVKVMENGNYFIEGSREILVDGEKQIMRVSGVIRPYDISTANSVQSSLVADARIKYETEGELRKGTSKGWLTKTLESIWPF